MKYQKLEINPYNYEAYAALLGTYFVNKENKKELKISAFFAAIAQLIAYPCILLGPATQAIALVMGIVVVREVFNVVKFGIVPGIKKRRKLKKRYSKLNTHIPYPILKNSLKEAGILVKQENGQSYVDTMEYRNYIKRREEQEKRKKENNFSSQQNTREPYKQTTELAPIIDIDSYLEKHQPKTLAKKREYKR